MSGYKQRTYGNASPPGQAAIVEILMKRYLELMGMEPEKLTPDIMRHIDSLSEQICRLEAADNQNKIP